VNDILRNVSSGDKLAVTKTIRGCTRDELPIQEMRVETVTHVKPDGSVVTDGPRVYRVDGRERYGDGQLPTYEARPLTEADRGWCEIYLLRIEVRRLARLLASDIWLLGRDDLQGVEVCLRRSRERAEETRAYLRGVFPAHKPGEEA
jgi:hypothetical protein